MLADVMDVSGRAGALLDDPSNSRFTLAYLMPFIDQCYAELDVMLENAGMQYVEAIAVVNVAAGVSDLASLLADGQPLATMKFPKWVKWKLQGQPDYLYNLSAFANELDEVDTATSVGALQWRFADGALQVTPSVTPMTLKIYFDQQSTDRLDPAQNVIRGTAHILAFAVASEAAGAVKGMENRALGLEAKRKAAWNQFKGVLVKNNQGKQIVAPPMHPRRGVATPYIPAPSS